ncbi:hypothetical protein ARALYDRAFT_336279 [Arabidopsis lyrata subsp. lyrata]|uniref:Uncharacterized protein n=1 Tax=Arabidopsis lyrata subsp. lyrata TaxID=81972 RepID=D7KHF0_ARALL|nr:hypothetical protein ARALYDRAFT_336279 [Arabidopsis lyrata subsp. lyrata]
MSTNNILYHTFIKSPKLVWFMIQYYLIDAASVRRIASLLACLFLNIICRSVLKILPLRSLTGRTVEKRKHYCNLHNCPPLRKSEIEYYAMLAKVGVHHYNGKFSEVSDLSKWFSSYVYESPMLDTSDGLEFLGESKGTKEMELVSSQAKDMSQSQVDFQMKTAVFGGNLREKVAVFFENLRERKRLQQPVKLS